MADQAPKPPNRFTTNLWRTVTGSVGVFGKGAEAISPVRPVRAAYRGGKGVVSDTASWAAWAVTGERDPNRSGFRPLRSIRQGINYLSGGQRPEYNEAGDVVGYTEGKLCKNPNASPTGQVVQGVLIVAALVFVGNVLTSWANRLLTKKETNAVKTETEAMRLTREAVEMKTQAAEIRAMMAGYENPYYTGNQVNTHRPNGKQNVQDMALNPKTNEYEPVSGYAM